jgi:hypothetical protein
MQAEELDKLESAFHDEWMRAFYETFAKTRFRSFAWLEMVEEMGSAVAAAKHLIKSPRIADGYYRLHQSKLLYLSIEAIVVENPQFYPLFTPAEIERAKRRLRAFGYEGRGASDRNGLPRLATRRVPRGASANPSSKSARLDRQNAGRQMRT